MTLTLTPELEERLERHLRGGRWQSPSEVLETALDLLDGLGDVIVLSKEELNDKLEQSFTAAERGDSVSSEEFLSGLDRWKAALK